MVPVRSVHQCTVCQQTDPICTFSHKPWRSIRHLSGHLHRYNTWQESDVVRQLISPHRSRAEGELRRFTAHCLLPACFLNTDAIGFPDAKGRNSTAYATIITSISSPAGGHH
uniref:hypothetical protein n=1 Tax=Salmonella sp. TaxID=599 RepID=UPI001CDA54B1|nr:hypothetical protein [Salmonella sp.]